MSREGDSSGMVSDKILMLSEWELGHSGKECPRQRGKSTHKGPEEEPASLFREQQVPLWLEWWQRGAREHARPLVNVRALASTHWATWEPLEG